MPVYSRRGLGQNLAFNYINDALLGTNEVSLPQAAQSVFVLDDIYVDLSLSGMGLYQGAWIYQNSQQYQVASYNVASGAFVSQQRARDTVTQDAFEIHHLLSPQDKQRTITETVRGLRVRREITTPAVEGAEFYDIDSLGGGQAVIDILDVYAYAAPAGSLSRDKRSVHWWKVQTGGSGLELRLYPGLSASWHLGVDAILDLTLGASLDATIELPHQEWVLAGAAARCAEMLTRTRPADAAMRRQRGNQPPPQYQPPPPQYWAGKQREWAREFTRFSHIYAPRRATKQQLGEPW